MNWPPSTPVTSGSRKVMCRSLNQLLAWLGPSNVGSCSSREPASFRKF